jgi:GT2 family glycosyltransferase/glycosyltransferase involved in cell wall biosynthesis
LTNADLEKRIAALERELRELSADLLEAEKIRQITVTGLDRFQAQFNSNLQAYRSERAWKVMLALRKAYTLLTRRGFPAFLRWAIALPFAGPGALDEFELRFPNIWNYMPERLEEDTPLPLVESAPEPRPLLYDLIVFAIFDFEFRFQRPQQIAAQFARLGHRVFWVSPGRMLPESSADPYKAIPLRENIWEIRLRGTRPDLYSGRMTPQDTEFYGESLQPLYRDFQIFESCALLQFPYWRQAGLKLRDQFGARMVYDCMDDWQSWTAEPRISDHNLAEESRLASECDVLLVSAQHLYERYAAAGFRPLLVRNAADYELFSAPQQNALLAAIPKPIVGYYGAIADWFDLKLLATVAASRPQYNFVLIGQVHEIDVSRLRVLPNVHLLGEKHYREIPRYLSNFDACIIPFKLNRLTNAVDPVKLYEYFSQGKPVVATNLAELPRDAGLLYIGMDADDFANKVDLALAAEDSANRDLRIAYARSNTWALRCHEIDRAVAESFPRVSILIVTYNCEEFIGPCLDSVSWNTSWPNYEVIIVDNCSTDGGAATVERYARADGRIRFIRQDKNCGFAGGSNLAAQSASGGYLLLLNPDVLVPPGWLGRLVLHLIPDKTIGAVAAVTNFSGNETKIRFDYHNSAEMEAFATDLAFRKANQWTDIAVAPLYCVLVPRPVWDRVGGLDPGYQVGMFEDDDFSQLVKNAGYRVIAAEDCFVHHFGNGSFSKLPPEDSLRIFEQNKRYFENKWKRSWMPHELRSGVRPPAEEIRFTPSEFGGRGK